MINCVFLAGKEKVESHGADLEWRNKEEEWGGVGYNQTWGNKFNKSGRNEMIDGLVVRGEIYSSEFQDIILSVDVGCWIK